MKKPLLFLLAVLLLAWPVLAEDGQEPAGYIALTFDDGPSGPITERLLDGLRDRDAHATFFLCGYRMDQYPAPLSRYVSEGHELGVHSWDHVDQTRLSVDDLHRDVKQTAQKIFTVTGVRPTLLRPPGGAWNENVKREAAGESLSILLWSVDPRDWATRDADAVLTAMAASVGDGDVVLLHDMSDSSVDAALRLIDRLSAQGYRFVTVTELAAIRGVSLAPGEVYRALPGK